jgi:hypothetical protein
MSLAPVVCPSRKGKALQLAVLAVPLCLHAASSPAHRRPRAPSVSELAKLVAEQGRALKHQQREIEALRKQLAETPQLSLSAHNRLEEMATAAPARTASAAVEERLVKIEASVQQIPDVPEDVAMASSARAQAQGKPTVAMDGQWRARGPDRHVLFGHLQETSTSAPSPTPTSSS